MRGRLTAYRSRACAARRRSAIRGTSASRRSAVRRSVPTLPLVKGVRARTCATKSNASFAGPFALNETQQQANTVFGLSGDGNPRPYGEYRARDAFSGTRRHGGDRPASPLGSEARRAPRRRVRTAPAIRGGTGEAIVAVFGAEYTRDPLWKGTARVELRNTAGADYWLATGGFARKLTRDFTALGRGQWTETSTDDEIRARFGLAYRRTDDKPLRRALARWEIARRHRRSTATTCTNIASAHAAWQANRHWPWTASSRRAGSSRARTRSRRTPPCSSRRDAHGGFSPPWDAGLTGRVLTSNHFDEKQFGAGVELGRALAKNLRAAAGWNVFGFRSAGLAAADVTDAGPYVSFGWKFDETLFGGLAKEGCPVNRTHTLIRSLFTLGILFASFSAAPAFAAASDGLPATLHAPGAAYERRSDRRGPRGDRRLYRAARHRGAGEGARSRGAGRSPPRGSTPRTGHTDHDRERLRRGRVPARSFASSTG